MLAGDGPSRTVSDGSFQATSELVAGYWLWEVKDMNEAVEWIKRCPNPMPGPSEIEIRPIYVKGVDKVYHCGGEKLSHWCDDKGVQGE